MSDSSDDSVDSVVSVLESRIPQSSSISSEEIPIPLCCSSPDCSPDRITALTDKTGCDVMGNRHGGDKKKKKDGEGDERKKEKEPKKTKTKSKSKGKPSGSQNDGALEQNDDNASAVFHSTEDISQGACAAPRAAKGHNPGADGRTKRPDVLADINLDRSPATSSGKGCTSGKGGYWSSDEESLASAFGYSTPLSTPQIKRNKQTSPSGGCQSSTERLEELSRSIERTIVENLSDQSPDIKTKQDAVMVESPASTIEKPHVRRNVKKKRDLGQAVHEGNQTFVGDHVALDAYFRYGSSVTEPGSRITPAESDKCKTDVKKKEVLDADKPPQEGKTTNSFQGNFDMSPWLKDDQISVDEEQMDEMFISCIDLSYNMADICSEQEFTAGSEADFSSCDSRRRQRTPHDKSLTPTPSDVHVPAAQSELASPDSQAPLANSKIPSEVSKTQPVGPNASSFDLKTLSTDQQKACTVLSAIVKPADSGNVASNANKSTAKPTKADGKSSSVSKVEKTRLATEDTDAPSSKCQKSSNDSNTTSVAEISQSATATSSGSNCESKKHRKKSSGKSKNKNKVESKKAKDVDKMKVEMTQPCATNDRDVNTKADSPQKEDLVQEEVNLEKDIQGGISACEKSMPLACGVILDRETEKVQELGIDRDIHMADKDGVKNVKAVNIGEHSEAQTIKNMDMEYSGGREGTTVDPTPGTNISPDQASDVVKVSAISVECPTPLKNPTMTDQEHSADGRIQSNVKKDTNLKIGTAQDSQEVVSVSAGETVNQETVSSEKTAEKTVLNDSKKDSHESILPTKSENKTSDVSVTTLPLSNKNQKEDEISQEACPETASAQKTLTKSSTQAVLESKLKEKHKAMNCEPDKAESISVNKSVAEPFGKVTSHVPINKPVENLIFPSGVPPPSPSAMDSLCEINEEDEEMLEERKTDKTNLQSKDIQLFGETVFKRLSSLIETQEQEKSNVEENEFVERSYYDKETDNDGSDNGNNSKLIEAMLGTCVESAQHDRDALETSHSTSVRSSDEQIIDCDNSKERLSVEKDPTPQEEIIVAENLLSLKRSVLLVDKPSDLQSKEDGVADDSFVQEPDARKQCPDSDKEPGKTICISQEHKISKGSETELKSREIDGKDEGHKSDASPASVRKRPKIPIELKQAEGTPASDTHAKRKTKEKQILDSKDKEAKRRKKDDSLSLTPVVPKRESQQIKDVIEAYGIADTCELPAQMPLEHSIHVTNDDASGQRKPIDFRFLRNDDTLVHMIQNESEHEYRSASHKDTEIQATSGHSYGVLREDSESSGSCDSQPDENAWSSGRPSTSSIDSSLRIPEIEETFSELLSVKNILEDLEDRTPTAERLPSFAGAEGLRSPPDHISGSGRRSRMSPAITDRTESDLDISEQRDDISTDSMYADDEDDGMTEVLFNKSYTEHSGGEVVLSCTFYNTTHANEDSDDFWDDCSGGEDSSYRQFEISADAASSTFQNARKQMHDIHEHLQDLRRQMEHLQDDLQNATLTPEYSMDSEEKRPITD